MTVLVTVELQPAAAEVENMINYLKEVIPDTRGYKGCQDINIYLEETGRTIIMIEHWDAKADYEKYLNWRIETGVMEKLGAMLDGEPIIRFAENTGA